LRADFERRELGHEKRRNVETVEGAETPDALQDLCQQNSEMACVKRGDR
jgi:hypothetical protein